MHSDVLILKLWFAVHRMLQGCATNYMYISFSLTSCGSFMGMGGLAPLVPHKLRPSLPPRFPPHFLVHSFSFLAKLTRCSYAAAVHCNVHYGPTITQPFHRYDTFENRGFKRLSKPVKAAIVYLQCMFRDSHCYFFFHAPEKWGVRYPPPPHTPTPKSGGYAYPPYPRKLRLCS